MTYTYTVTVDTWLPTNKVEQVIKARTELNLPPRDIARTCCVPQVEVYNILEQLHMFRSVKQAVELTCVVCGDTTIRFNYHAKYCSEACRQEAYRCRKKAELVIV